jgi:hypothetical protein
MMGGIAVMCVDHEVQVGKDHLRLSAAKSSTSS